MESVLTNSEDLNEFYSLYPDIYQKKVTLDNTQREINALLSIVPEWQPGVNLLDICCGEGRHLSILSKKGFICSGIDINENLVNLARSKLGDKATQILKGDILHLSDFYQPDCFDGAYILFCSIEHFLYEQLVNIFTQLRNLLKPDAYLVIEHSNAGWYEKNPVGKSSFETDQLSRTVDWRYNHETGELKFENFIQWQNANRLPENFTIKAKVYRLNQLTDIFQRSGLIVEGYYDMDGRPYLIEDNECFQQQCFYLKLRKEVL